MSLIQSGASSMRRFAAPAVAVTMTLAAFTPATIAQVPDIVKMAPAGTEIFIGTSNLTDLDKQFEQLLTAIELNNMIPFSPLDMFGEMGMDPASLDFTRPAGIAMLPGVFDQNRNQEEPPPMLMFLPVEDYGQWLASLDPNADTAGIATIDMGDPDNPGYARKVGSYAVVGPHKNNVEAYKAGDVAANHISTRMGTVGAELAARCQLFAVIDLSSLSEMRHEIIDEMTRGIEDSMGGMGAMGAPGMDPAQIAEMNRAIIEMFFDEATTAAAGVRFSDRGVAFDFAIQTKEGSEVGATIPGEANARNLLSNFADAPFMMAMSMDMKGIQFGKLMDIMNDRLNLAALQGNNTGSGMETWRDADGVGMAIYPSPAGLFGGALSKSVFLLTGNTEKLMQTMQEATEAADGNDTNGILVTTEYKKNVREIAGHQADTYAVKMKFPPELMMAQQQIAMVYGPGGLQGYVVAVKNGVIQTMSRNSEVVEQTIAAMNGEGKNLGANRVLAAADELLPANPMMKMYIGLGTISEQVGPLVAMAVPGLNLEELAAMPPLAMAMGAADGGIVGSFAIPAPVLKTAAEMAQQFGPMGGGVDVGAEEEPPLF